MLMNLKNRFESNKMDEEYFQQKIASAQEQLQFLSRTVDDFKEFYIPAKHKEPFSLTRAVQNSITVILPDLKSKGIVLEWQPCDDEVFIFGKKNELSHVILALISNASDALQGTKNPKISVLTRCVDTNSVIIIEDNGCGIAGEKLDKIFEPYYTTKAEGSGIGLYLSKMIVETGFGGKIEVKSKIREGTRFILSIECTTEHADT